jgi:hypothetical protein
MSEFAKAMYLEHCNFIKELCYLTNCRKYLELGIYDGTTIEKIVPIVDYAVGVDIKDVRRNKVGNFFLGTTDDFFKANTTHFDIIFIDADHSKEAVYKDLQNSLQILNKYGIIILHDTDPLSEELVQPGYCGDCYKVINNIFNTILHEELNVITMPVSQCGLTLINRKRDRRVFEFQKTKV